MGYISRVQSERTQSRSSVITFEISGIMFDNTEKSRATICLTNKFIFISMNHDFLQRIYMIKNNFIAIHARIFVWTRAKLFCLDDGTIKSIVFLYLKDRELVCRLTR